MQFAFLHLPGRSRLATIALLIGLPAAACVLPRVLRRIRTRMTASSQAAPGPSVPVAGFHRRPLPPPSIALSSPEGKKLAKEAVASGGMEGFWRLAESFRTQDEPAFCGLGTLVSVLNALFVDPGRTWKGPWRWYSETMLDCCVDMSTISTSGVTWDEWVCLGRCQGLRVEATRADEGDIDAFRALVRATCTEDVKVLCVGYSRRTLGQTGDGHYSPVGGYHADTDRVLILDVARFKHPPHWVPLAKLWEAMCATDAETSRPRGYALFSRADGGSTTRRLLTLTFGRDRMPAARAFFNGRKIADAASGAGSAAEELWRVARALPAPVASLLSVVDTTAIADTDADALRVLAAARALKATPVRRALAEAFESRARTDGPLPITVDAAAALFLVIGAAVGDDTLRTALPRAAPLLIDPIGEVCQVDASDVEALRSDLAEARRQLGLMRGAAACGGSSSSDDCVSNATCCNRSSKCT